MKEHQEVVLHCKNGLKGLLIQANLAHCEVTTNVFQEIPCLANAVTAFVLNLKVSDIVLCAIEIYKDGVLEPRLFTLPFTYYVYSFLEK